MAHLTTSLNWHSYNGVGNGAGLQSEIAEVQKIANSFTPPKPLVLTEWLARPAQPVAAAYPVIRDNGVAGYNWALTFVNCTTGWAKPVGPGDPPFQGMLWPQTGAAYDPIEEVECMKNACKTLEYVHHCCNGYNKARAGLFSFDSPSWKTVSFGNPTYKRPGPREASLRQAVATAGASFTLGPLPSATRRVALYLPTSPLGAGYTVTLDDQPVHSGTTKAALNWVARVVLTLPPPPPAAGAWAGGSNRTVRLTVDPTAPAAAVFNVSGATLFYTDGG